MATCAHCQTDFQPKPRRNRHGVIGEPQGGRFCSGRCRLRAHRSRSKILGSVQAPRQSQAEEGVVRETPLDHVHLLGRREPALETPIIRESKPPSQLLDPRIIPDAK